jgi:hypothetical protein
MSKIFRLVLASLQSYKPNAPPKKRGRPTKTIYDIDRKPVDEVINDTKSNDGLRGKTGAGGNSRQPIANREN